MSTSGETPREVPVDSADRLRADIVVTRGELSDTVGRLAAKLDVRANAKRRMDVATGNAKRRMDDAAGLAKRRMDDAAGLAKQYRVQIAATVVTALVATAAMQLRRHTRFGGRRSG